MRLKDVIIQGKFCGLETVEECILNWELHVMYLYPHSQVPYEAKELIKDIQAWEAGTLVFDWDEIDRLVAESFKEYENWHRDNISDPVPEEKNFEKICELLS